MLHSILLVLGVVCNTTRPIAEMCTSFAVKVHQIQPASAGVAAQKQQEFCDFLLATGNGTQPTLLAHGLSNTADTVQLPPSMVYSAKTLDDFIDQVFGELGTADLTGKAILSTLNSEINAINAKVTERFPGQVKLSNAALAFATGLNLQTV